MDNVPDLTRFGEAGIALMGLLSFLFGNPEDPMGDKEYLEAHEFVQPYIVNGDPIDTDPNDPESYNSHELRDQITPDQWQALEDEAELRRMGPRRN